MLLTQAIPQLLIAGGEERNVPVLKLLLCAEPGRGVKVVVETCLADCEELEVPSGWVLTPGLAQPLDSTANPDVLLCCLVTPGLPALISGSLGHLGDLRACSLVRQLHSLFIHINKSLLNSFVVPSPVPGPGDAEMTRQAGSWPHWAQSLVVEAGNMEANKEVRGLQQSINTQEKNKWGNVM